MDPTRLMLLEATVTTVNRAATADVFGDPEAELEATTVRCWLEQANRNEDTTNADLGAARWDLYLPPDTVLKSSDRVTVAGVEYEVDGPPWPATNPRTTAVTHIEATLRRTA